MYTEGKKEEAIQEYETAAKEAPESGQPLQSLGDLYLREKDYLKSRKAYLLGIDCIPQNSDNAIIQIQMVP